MSIMTCCVAGWRRADAGMKQKFEECPVSGAGGMRVLHRHVGVVGSRRTHPAWGWRFLLAVCCS